MKEKYYDEKYRSCPKLGSSYTLSERVGVFLNSFALCKSR